MTHHDKARELVERLKQWDGCWPAPGLERDVLAAAGAITALSERVRALEGTDGFCTDCDSVTVPSDGRCGCGSGRIMSIRAALSSTGEKG